MKLRTLFSISAALALLAGPISTLAATHVWSGAAADGSWSDPANWSSGGPPGVFETPPLFISFPNGAANYNTTNDIGGFGFYLQPDAIFMTGNNYVIAGNTNSALVMTGNPAYIEERCIAECGPHNFFYRRLGHRQWRGQPRIRTVVHRMG
jgi:hypothetical protein